MCGIVGAVGKIYSREEDVFKLLSKLDTIRGEHSTGVCSVTKDIGDWQTQKMVGTPFDLFATKGANEMLSKRTHNMLFGHNRQATRGDITDDNAHPFDHDHIVGCHNGTILSTLNLKDHHKFKVDSDNIFYDMAHNGAKETIKKLNGPFALCWYDANTHTINLVRNKERPLYYCYTKDHKTLFWASESWMLHVAMSKCDLPRDEIIPLEDGILLTVDVPVVAGSSVDTVEHRQEGVEFYKAPAFRESEDWSWDGWRGTRSYHQGSTYTPYKERETGSQTSSQTTSTVVNINDKRSSAKLAGRFLGKTVTFSVVGKGQQGNLKHIKCDIEDQADAPELRVFTDFNSQLGVMLLNSPHMFKGKIKSITGAGSDAYALVDHRSIVMLTQTEMLLLEGPEEEEHAPLNEDDEKAIVTQSAQDYADSLKDSRYTGYMGKLLTAETYYRLTQSGCAMCNDYPNLNGRDKLAWFTETEFFCERCSKTQFAHQWLAAG